MEKEKEEKLRNWIKRIANPEMAIAILAMGLVLAAAEIYSLYQTRVAIDEELSAYTVIARCKVETSSARVLEKDGNLYLFCGYGTNIPGIPILK